MNKFIIDTGNMTVEDFDEDEIKEELMDEIRDEIKEELMDEIRDEIRQELVEEAQAGIDEKFETIDNILSELESIADDISSGARRLSDQLGDLTTETSFSVEDFI